MSRGPWNSELTTPTGERITQTYDDNGNLASRTDFNGRLTTYTYELSRNLETRRVEASGQAEARTISRGGKRGQGRLRAQLFIQPGLARYNRASRLNQSLGLLISKYGYAL
ncbi:MAG: RHS repeat domain-containing protein [Candidatus Accumulibacter necessarius]|jgi:YD repeat-containing protein